METTTGYEELSKDIVIYRGFLTLNEQKEMINDIPKYFQLLDENNEYNYPDNKGNKKGRCFSKIEYCPPSVISKLEEIKRVIEEKNKVFVYPAFTHACTGKRISVINRHDMAPYALILLSSFSMFFY